MFVSSLKISTVKDEYKLLQVEEIPECWYKEEDGTYKRLDQFWAKIFNIKNGNGLRKYPKLSLVSLLFLGFDCLSEQENLNDESKLVFVKHNLYELYFS